jgi:uncharacterized protein DUF3309
MQFGGDALELFQHAIYGAVLLRENVVRQILDGGSIVGHADNADRGFTSGFCNGRKIMSLGLILVILLVIFLLGGFSGRFGGYGYGYGHGGIGVIGVILVILVVLLLMGRL